LQSCKDFFIEHDQDRDRCKSLQKLNEGVLLQWEKEPASQYSPGPVLTDERLYRQFLNPTHFDTANNILKVTAFSDTSDKGGSVNRTVHISYENAIKAAQDRAEKITEGKQDGSKVELWNLVELNCRDIRAIMTPSQPGTPPRRGFAVYDTALQNDDSHADICQIVSGTATGRSVRSKLLDLANEFIKAKLS
jgi:hypothetical protein